MKKKKPSNHETLFASFQEDMINMYLETPLSEIEKEKILKTDPFVIKIIEKNNLSLDTMKDYLVFTILIHGLTINRILSNIQLRIIKHNLQEQKEQTLTTEEVLNIVYNTKVNFLTSLFHKVDLNLPWEEVSQIYQDIHKIILLEELAPIKFFNNRPKQTVLEELKQKNWKILGSYYACIKNIQNQKEYIPLGIDSYIEKQTTNINERIEEKRETERENERIKKAMFDTIQEFTKIINERGFEGLFTESPEENSQESSNQDTIKTYQKTQNKND